MDIICLSHLKWEETLFQRPQQLMLRLARQHRVLYLANCGTREYFSALRSGNRAFIKGRACERLAYENIPFLPLTRRFPALHDMHLRHVVRRARVLSRRLEFSNPLLWIYYPTFIDHISSLPHSRLIYDCMDQFSGFEGSHAGVGEEERRLLRQADIVFTGGRSLQRAKEGINPRTHCFPSGVEFDHFHKATLPETTIPLDVASIPHPILGYFGAIDERVDLELIRHICRQRPQWSVVFIGPVIGGERPPVEASNFHYLGKKRYAELPNYLKAFDVCLMPFVDSPLTAHISPTKTPEYLAGGKPVVSTPVPDVVADYKDVVRIAGSHDAFLAAVEEALGDRDSQAQEAFLQKARGRSWDAIAGEMMELIERIGRT